MPHYHNTLLSLAFLPAVWLPGNTPPCLSLNVDIELWLSASAPFPLKAPPRDRPIIPPYHSPFSLGIILNEPLLMLGPLPRPLLGACDKIMSAPSAESPRLHPRYTHFFCHLITSLIHQIPAPSPIHRPLYYIPSQLSPPPLSPNHQFNDPPSAQSHSLRSITLSPLCERKIGVGVRLLPSLARQRPSPGLR